MAEAEILTATAVSIGFVHTLLGPDHYLPFAAMARAGQWSLRRTFWVTALCGVGHVAGSVVLGLIGISVGLALFQLEHIEAHRGQIAAWLLVVFGVGYTAWGVWKAIRGEVHSHVHMHADGTIHRHPHSHSAAHVNAHEHGHVEAEHGYSSTDSRLTPWVLFTIFVFGPCEPLIPLVMVPASKGDAIGVLRVAGVFGLTTIAVMLTVVMGMQWGFGLFRLKAMERYMHALAGLTLTACGVAMCMGL